jgi:hypothetical protein
MTKNEILDQVLNTGSLDGFLTNEPDLPEATDVDQAFNRAWNHLVAERNRWWDTIRDFEMAYDELEIY